ncbi:MULTISPECIES: DMT family transporter [Azospira]|jgi:drug/metabolite transporter (DMT)-like permease|uniref:DMT(Drug/metabolite transporter) superfamily permease n=2 Tax=Azospira oryzae TaxID=146939 RepID=G8QFP3_AZOOP|nr:MULTISPECIES: DMT family transporter [Azospira]TLS19084.1 MAG: DMT family transporter [Betaproteobacteria bacterium]AEV27156.1 DMT(drug/metabolite transporter) superfamily permease [Azospira oryzae PS]MBP7489963.1 DMT family transporter [Azospira sp.]MDK9691618.1 DMT family transporter [Azospira sp.]RZT90055.1 drug/metabolite transporter (DMT)-like permease [Azospira oryzae]
MNPNTPLYRHPYLLLTLTALFWSGNMVLGRGIRADVPPIALAFWRWVIALALIAPLALPHLKEQWPLLKKGWKPVLLLGILGVGCYNTFAYVALQYTAATNAVLLNSFIPIVTIALSWLFLGKRLKPIEAVGVAISFLGATTIIARGDLAVLLGLSLNLGDVWMLGAVLTWAIYTVGLQWRPAGVHPMLMLGALTLVGVLALAPIYAHELGAFGGPARHINLHWGSLAGIAYVGVLPSFVGYIFYNRGVAEVGANKASLFIHLMPVFGTLLSALFLGELPHLYHFVGIGLIFSGIYLTMARLPRLKGA